MYNSSLNLINTKIPVKQKNANFREFHRLKEENKVTTIKIQIKMLHSKLILEQRWSSGGPGTCLGSKQSYSDPTSMLVIKLKLMMRNQQRSYLAGLA